MLQDGDGAHLPHDLLYRPEDGLCRAAGRLVSRPAEASSERSGARRSPADSGLFNPATLRRLVEQHQSGMRDHSAPLWSLLMFEAFLRAGGVETARAAPRATA